MAIPVWLNNLFAYSLQIAILAAAGTLLAYLFRLRAPRVSHIYWQALLLACLLVPIMQSWKHPVINLASPANPASPAPTILNAPVEKAAVPLSPKQPFHIPSETFPLILAAGVCLRLLWLALGFVRLRLFLRKSRRFEEAPPVIQDMQQSTGIRASVFLSDEIDSPITFGIRTPAVILPPSFNTMSEPCQKAVFCHELLHVRRRDWAHIVAEELIRSIYWFHPAIWWLLGRIHLSREQLVDCDVVQLTGNKQPYLDSLLEIARAHGRPRAVPAPLFLKERHLVQRVALLLKEVTMSKQRMVLSLVGISLILIGTVQLAAGWFPFTAEATIVQQPEINAPQREPIRVGGNVQESKLIRQVNPVYPELAKQARVSGSVVLIININEEGFVSDAQVKSGHPLLNDAAVAAVKQWKYSPTLMNGRPVPVIATVTVVFNLMDVQNVAANAASAIVPQQAWEIIAPQKEPLRVGGAVQESKLIRKVNPVYPELAKRARVTGTVILMVTTNEEGFVWDVKVQSGHPLLNDAAVTAVKQWQYSPTLLNGMPVPVIATVTVIFNLMDSGDLMVNMDEFGNLSSPFTKPDDSPLMPKIVQATGIVRISIHQATPIKTAETVIKDLLQKGVQKIQINGLYSLYQGRLFYRAYQGREDVKAPELAFDMNRLIEMSSAAQNGSPAIQPLAYSIYVNEVGEILGLERSLGPEIPEIERELAQTHVITPGRYNLDPAPVVAFVMIAPKNSEGFVGGFFVQPTEIKK